MKKNRENRKAPVPGDNKGLLLFSLAVILFFISIAAYYPVLGDSFHSWDDDVYITANARVLKGLNPDNVKWAFSTTYFGFYYPLTWLSHMTDVQLYGLDPKGHYRTSILLHSFNVVLFFIFLCASTKACYRSFFAAMLFALHPMNVESVAWLAERKNLLSVFFLLLALIFYVLKVKSAAGGRRSLFYTCALYLFFMMGLMSKSSIVTFPLLLLLLDFWPLGRASFDGLAKQSDVLKKLVIEKTPLFILSLISGILTIAAQKETDAVASLDYIPFSQRVGEALLGIGFYVEKLFYPVRLCLLYPHHKGDYPLLLPFLIFSASCAATLIFFRYRRTLPSLMTGWLFFIVSLLPVIGIIQVGAQAYADRYVYFAYWGLFMVLVFGIAWEKMASRNFGLKILLAVVPLVLMISLFMATRAQAATWKDDEALFSNVTKVSPKSGMGYFQLGNFYRNEGDWNRASSLYEKALDCYDEDIKHSPGSGLGYYHKACTLINLKRGEEAVNNLELARAKGFNPSEIQNKIKFAEFTDCNRLWKELSSQKKWDEAESTLRKALSIYPEKPDVWCSLGYVLQMKGDQDGAEKAYEKALSLDDSLEIAIHNLGVIEFKKNDIQKTRERLEALEVMNSPYASSLKDLLAEKQGP